ncbi:hypothetical protein DPMN_145122 [Dreissena polymorpha]|uniref:Uncharacterized protein n=1 Tax=Dreissena polymorpha TaxID=45954 RepID=A0A9D4F4D1_DREPO|nr:hypothetical protein DPMN_145122 [Dreissena polymorpha]
MARQRPTRLVKGPCIVEMDQVNRCRNEEIIVKGIFGGPPGLVMQPCIVEIDCIVIREVQYQFEVNRCRNKEIIVKVNFGWAWPMWAGRPRVGNGSMHMNRLKGNFGWAWPMWEGPLKIDHIVIREVQYQFEVNQCRNEEIIVKGNFGWAWPMWAGRPRIDRIVIREVQYQFEDNRYYVCKFQGSSANRRTDRRTAEITTISPRFSKSVGIKTILAGRPRVGNGAIHDDISLNW